MVAAPLTISPLREEVVDFSYPFWHESIGMLTLTLPQDQVYILKPLRTAVWICYFTSTFLVAVFLYIYEVKLNVMKKYIKTTPLAGIGDCIWHSLCISTFQGVYTIILSHTLPVF